MQTTEEGEPPEVRALMLRECGDYLQMIRTSPVWKADRPAIIVKWPKWKGGYWQVQFFAEDDDGDIDQLLATLMIFTSGQAELVLVRDGLACGDKRAIRDCLDADLKTRVNAAWELCYGWAAVLISHLVGLPADVERQLQDGI